MRGTNYSSGFSRDNSFEFFDQDTRQKLLALDQEKSAAVASENFELAKHLKGQIDRLKTVGVQLQNLDGQK